MEETIDIQTDGYCAVCGNDFDATRAGKKHDHHLQWNPEEMTMPVCQRCHTKIHLLNGGLEYYRPKEQPPSRDTNRLRMRRKRKNPAVLDRINALRRADNENRKIALRAWRAKHPEKIREYNQKYRKVKNDDESRP